MSISKEQQSVLAIIGGALMLALISHNYVFLIIAGAIGVTLPFAILNTPVHKAWIFVSKVLGWISRHIILFLLFFFFLTPFALLLRLFGKQTIARHWKKEESYFSERNHVYTRGDFNNPW